MCVDVLFCLNRVFGTSIKANVIDAWMHLNHSNSTWLGSPSIGVGPSAQGPPGSSYSLIREFCLFSDDAKYVLVCAIANAPIEEFQSARSYTNMQANNEALEALSPSHLEDYIFFVVHLDTGMLIIINSLHNTCNCYVTSMKSLHAY